MGMNELRKSLEATNVLSEDYKSHILAIALGAVSESYRRGKADGEGARLDK